MKVLRLHLRNCPIRWVLPVLVALDIAIIFLRGRHWMGVWPATGAAAQVPSYLIGIVGSGAAAWAAASPSRHRIAEQMAAARVRPGVAEAYRFGATLIILLIPYLAGQAIAFTITAWTFPPGIHLWLGYFALGTFVTLLLAAWGWYLGKLLSPVVAALVAIVSCLFLMSRQTFLIVSGDPEVAVDPTGLAIRMVAIVLLLAALPWSHQSRRPTVRRWAPTPAVVALAGIVLMTTPTALRNPPGQDITCIEGATRLCLWPEHQKYVPQMAALNARLGALPEIFDVPPQINEVGLEWTRRIDPRGQEYIHESKPTFYIIEGSPWSSAGNIASAVLSATLPYGVPVGCNWEKLSDADRSRMLVLVSWLEAYLAGGGSPDYHSDQNSPTARAVEQGHALADSPALSGQFAWAVQEVTAIRDNYCRVHG